MKIKTIKSLLIAITATAILTGCNSKNTTIETEATTEIENLTETTTESETETTEIETSTTEESTSEIETKEVETSTIEETATEQETKDVIIKDSMTFAGDVDEADMNQIMKAVDAGVADMDICDINKDGIISKEEASSRAALYDDETIKGLQDTYTQIFGDDFTDSIVEAYKESNSSSTSNSTTESTPSTSTSTITPRKEDPNTRQVEPGSGDNLTYSTTSHSY